jgi:hypothetical protein
MAFSQSHEMFLFHILLYSRLFLFVSLTFAQDFTILNVICSHVGIISTTAVYTEAPFIFARYFYFLCNPAVFILPILLL